MARDRFQTVVGQEKVVEQIPFKNIARMELIKNPEGRDFVKNFIGIVLANVEDPETLCPTPEKIMELHGWHYRLTDDMWRMPLEQIYDRLQKRLASSGKEPT